MKRIWLGIFCGLLILGLAGCGKELEKANKGGVDSTERIEEGYPVTVQGAGGEELVLEAEPLRVVSVGPNITELLYSLGVQEKLVGRTDYCDYPKEVLSVDTIGTLYTPDVEKIISLEPDLVIASTHFLDETKEKLEAVGISVLVLHEENELEGVYRLIDTLGAVFNQKGRALEIVEDMQKRIAAVEEKVAEVEPISVYYVVGYGDGGDYTAGGDTFIHEILTAAGGRNVAEEVSGWSYSLEKLLEADPDVILVSEADYEGFVETEPYVGLRAVKEGRVYMIDENLLNRQCDRNADAVEQIARMLYPGVFS
ncbi:MAG: ABC transporter substrate-binding protein [Lachnospiraceae bacterium]|nr:ABC transporter substrate-binding protein [Lachnospiraceae bacterium]